MGFDYFVFYTEASVVCITILSLILISDKINSTKQEKQICFNRAIIAMILYFVSDACWAAIIGGQIPRIRTLVLLFNLLNYILLAIMGFEWFVYMAASENLAFRKSRKKRLLCFLPLVVSIAAVVTAYIVDPYFWISEAGELNILYYPPFILTPSAYLIISLIVSVRNARKTDNKDEKKQYLLIAVIPIGVIGFGILQLVIFNAPTFCFGCTIMFLFFYLQNIQTLISVDELTQLNNRGQISRYMRQVRYKENEKAFIIMMDIDRFKQINDNYGHAEGDRALVLTSEVLKQTCEPFKARIFIGRYGGDEFLLIVQGPQENESPEQIGAAIREALKNKRAENDLPYELEISFGYDELNKGESMKDCMIRADEKLYEVKRAKNIDLR